MRRTPLVSLALGIALALGPAAAHAGPMDKAPGEGKDLYKRDFRGQRLAGAEVDDAYLAGANFNGVSLGKAKMKWVIAFNATFVKARMQRVTMTNSVLDGSDFKSADLRRVRFQDSTGEDHDDSRTTRGHFCPLGRAVITTGWQVALRRPGKAPPPYPWHRDRGGRSPTTTGHGRSV